MIPDKLLSELNIVWEAYPIRVKGGQHVAVASAGVTLIVTGVGFRFSTDIKRSQIENKDLCMLMLEFFLIENKIIL